MPLFYVKIRKNIDICNYLPIYYPAICRGWGTFSVPSPGAGAAGGLGYALMAYLNADLRSGIDIMLELAHFDDAIRDADLVITGEGRSDAQTLMGKVPCGMLARCRREGVKAWLLSGAVDDTEGQLSTAFDLVAGINDADHRPLTVLMQPEVARHNLAATVARLVGGAG